jgi:hypothetical protein
MLSSLQWEFTVNIDCELARKSCKYSHRGGILLVNAAKVSLEKMHKIPGQVSPPGYHVHALQISGS